MRRYRTVVIIAVLAIALGLAMIRICADGGAMAGAFSENAWQKDQGVLAGPSIAGLVSA
jgi:hypothetical protein